MGNRASSLLVLGICALLIRDEHAGAHSVVPDGNLTDWTTRPLPYPNMGTIARTSTGAGSYVWDDATGDQRTDLGTAAYADLWRVQITGNAMGLGVLILTSGGPTGGEVAQFQISVDTDRVTGSGQAFLGSLADTTVAPAARWERLIVTTFHDAQSSGATVLDTSFTQVAGTAQAFATTSGTYEILVPWSMLGLFGPPTTPLRFTVSSYASKPDGTVVEIVNDATSNALDAIGDCGDPRQSGFPNAWDCDLSDAIVDFFVDLYFDAQGEVYAPLTIASFISAGVEHVSLRNQTSTPLSLDGFKLGDEEEPDPATGSERMATFPSGRTVQPNALFVVAANGSAYQPAFGELPDAEFTNGTTAADMVTFGAWSSGSFGLADAGDQIILLDPSNTILDVVNWGGTGGNFSGVSKISVAPGNGVRMARTPPTQDTDDNQNDFAANSAPALSPVGNQAGTEGAQLAFTLSATDVNGDNLRYAVDAITVPRTPDVAPTVDAITGAFTWTPAFTDAGTYTVTMRVSDGIASATETIEITIGEANAPPELAAIGNRSAAEGSTVAFTVTATEIDSNQTLTYAASPLPSGATFDAVTGAFSWDPGFLDAGSYDITFTVTDDGTPLKSDAETISITITNTNRTPILGSIGAQNLGENEELAFTLSANDDDTDDTLTYSASPLPTGATFNTTTGAFAWTPTFTQAGQYQITFGVSDGKGGSDSELVTVTVANVNRQPVLGAIGDKTVNENAQLAFVIAATDADTDDTLTYSAGNLPSGATFTAATRTFSWTPDYTQADTYTNVTFSVSDGKGGSDSQSITITVSDVNRDPTLTAIGARTVTHGATLDITLSASDPDTSDTLEFSATGLPIGATLSPAGAFSYTPDCDDLGDKIITFIVTDNKGAADSEAVTITVQGGRLELTPSTLDLGTKLVGQSATMTATVANVGSLPVTFVSASTTASVFTIPTAPSGVVSPTGTAIGVKFTPTASLDYTDTLSVAASDGSTCALAAMIDLVGRGRTSEIDVGPALGEFGDVRIDRTGAFPAQTFTLTNIGTAPVTVSNIVLVDTTNFSLDKGSFATSVELAPEATGTFTLQARPQSVGTHETTVTVMSDALGNTAIPIVLTATGIQPGLRISPVAIDFGAVRTGDTTTQMVTLTNTGTASVALGSVALVGAAASAYSVAPVTLPATLDVGESVELAVTYAPTAASNGDSVTLTIASDATEGAGCGSEGCATAAIALNGRGVEPAGGCCDASSRGSRNSLLLALVVGLVIRRRRRR